MQFEIQCTILNEEQGGSLASYTETDCGISCCNKNFQILLTSDLHELADDAIKNRNCISCPFIL